MVNLIKKITAAALSLTLIIISLSACSQGSEYDYLKDEIVGVWMDEGGPAVDTDNQFGKSLLFYEFTSDGMIYYHYINTTMNEGTTTDATVEGGNYHLKDNMFIFDEDNTGAIITIDGDTLTMSNNSGDVKYTRVSMADTVGYSIYCKDEGLLREQNVILYGEEYVSQSESESISESEAALTASETEENAETSSAEGAEEAATVQEIESESVSE